MDDETAEPVRAFNFRVHFDGDELAGFSGLGTELMVAEYRPGNENANLVRKVSAIYKIGDVTLRRGIVRGTDLSDWFEAPVASRQPMANDRSGSSPAFLPQRR